MASFTFWPCDVVLLQESSFYEQLENRIAAVKLIQKKDPKWFWKEHRREQKNNRPNGCLPPDDVQLDSGFAEVHSFARPSDSDSAVGDKNTSMFPYDLENYMNFHPPSDLHGDRRMHRKREQKPLNNAPPRSDASSWWNSSQRPSFESQRSGVGGFSNPVYTSSATPSSTVPTLPLQPTNLYSTPADAAGGYLSASGGMSRLPLDQASEYADSTAAQCPSIHGDLSDRGAFASDPQPGAVSFPHMDSAFAEDPAAAANDFLDQDSFVPEVRIRRFLQRRVLRTHSVLCDNNSSREGVETYMMPHFHRPSLAELGLGGQVPSSRTYMLL